MADGCKILTGQQAQQAYTSERQQSLHRVWQTLHQVLTRLSAWKGAAGLVGGVDVAAKEELIEGVPQT